MKYLDLPNGAKMPIVGYGTWQAGEGELDAALDAALEAGYRHIDTAYVYENEDVVGKVLKRWLDAGKVKREELFICTKLPEVGMRPDGVLKYLNRSLSKLQLDYIDLYLVHVPFGYIERGDEIHPRNENGEMLIDLTTDHLAIWKVLESQVKEGKVKNIGLSNFNARQIQRIVDNATIKPSNLQVETHAYMQQKELHEVCVKNGMTMTAYSPLGCRGMTKIYEMIGLKKELPDLFKNPVIEEISTRLKKTPAQILLRHTIQRGIAVIPKSVTPQRIKENFELFDFELSQNDIEKINALDQGSKARICEFQVFFKGTEKHPEYPF